MDPAHPHRAHHRIHPLTAPRVTLSTAHQHIRTVRHLHMSGYIRRANGTFAGSIGAGKTNTPHAAPAIAGRPTSDVDGGHDDTAVTTWYTRYQATHPDTPAPSPAQSAASSPAHVTLTDFNGQTRTVPAGDLDAARWFLVGGNCHSLAAALHEQTGLPIIVFHRDDWHPVNDDDDEYEADAATHYAVITETGHVLDGHGASLLADIEETYYWKGTILDGGIPAMRDLIEHDVQHLNRVWQPLNPDLVRSYVTPVLQHLPQ